MDELELELEIEEEKEDKTANEPQLDQPTLGPVIQGGATTNADIVFVIDATASMGPVIKTVKEFTLSLYDKLQEGMKKFHTSLNQVRVKVIAFRDYYCDGEYAMEESDFFYLPDEKVKFRDFVSNIEAKGGGDIPESALEAIALAMKSDWVKEGTSRRHIIVLFTDAPAHPLEKAKDGIPDNYPPVMFESYEDLLTAWGIGQGTCVEKDPGFKMDMKARRLVLFAPDAYPWNRMENEFDQALAKQLRSDKGGEELDDDLILNLLCKSVK